MKMEVYTLEEIDDVIGILETVQDLLEVEDYDILWAMLEEAIKVIAQGDEE